MDVLLVVAVSFAAGYAFRGAIGKEIKAAGAEIKTAIADFKADLAKKL